MHLTPESSRLSKKAARAVGLVLSLSALTAAGAQGAELVVPHSATHTVSPKAVPQPAAPQTGAPSAPGPSLPSTSPAEAGQQGAGESGSVPASSDPAGGVKADQGQQAPESFEMRWAKMHVEADTQFINDVQQAFSAGMVQNPLLVAAALAAVTEQLDEMNATIAELSMAPAQAIREVVGYSGVSDQVCGGSSFESANGDLEDPNNGIAFC